MYLFCLADVDECVEGLDDCDVNALCTDTVGSFTCDCLDGFVGNGITCAGTSSFTSVTENCKIAWVRRSLAGFKQDM